MRDRRKRRLVLERLEVRRVLSAAPIISEFLAANRNSIRDADGDSSDWIEVYNPGASPINLLGWTLTDDAAELDKWRFPAVELAAGGYLVVFASGKDRRDATGELHTNFSLSADGEYLALLAPDGATIASAFTPSFPEQRPDLSYGVAMHEEPLVASGAPLAWHVPNDDTLGQSWADADFDDSSWSRTIASAPALLVTEASTALVDYVEIQNVGTIPIDVESWVVVANNPSGPGGINSAHQTVWELGPTPIAPGETLYATDAEDDHYWGENIQWGTTGNGWVMILDDEGALVDFVAWGYSSAQIASMNVSVAGWSVSVGSAWSGAGAPASGTTSTSLQRIGNGDTQSLADFSWTTASKGATNQGLIMPFESVGVPARTGVGFALPGSDTVDLYKQTVAADPGLVGYWRLGDVGATANDETGTHQGSYAGQIMHGSAGALSGDVDEATDFRGGRVIVPSAPGLDSGGQNLTVETWVQPDSASTFGWIVAKDNGNASLDYLLGYNSGGSFRFITQGLTNDLTAPTPAVINGANWYHVVGVQNATAGIVNLFVNGVLVQSAAFEPGNITSGGPLIIGDRSSGGQTVDGRIDEVAIFRRALDDEVVLAHYQIGREPRAALSRLIGTDAEEGLHGHNSSAYVRVPFEVAGDVDFDTLSLQMRYDDGFVAYLNGAEVARRNAPAATTWNSTATTARANRNAISVETIDISEHLSALRAGENVLAIQGLNVSESDLDFLVLPELSALRLLDGPLYLSRSTPGSANSDGRQIEFVADTRFNRDRGLYDAPFELSIATDTTGTVIRYTTDGSEPTEAHGEVYAGPIPIATTTMVRAAAFKDGAVASNVDTQTYVFLADVVRQPRNPAGFPATWSGGFPADYEMDPVVVDDPQYSASLLEGLRAIPSVSLVMDQDDLFGASRGFYYNSSNEGPAWERAASIEFFDPPTGEQFQVNAGVRISGATTIHHFMTPKHSILVQFKDAYGDAKLSHRVFPDSTVEEFDDLVLRNFSVDSWLQNEDPSRLIYRHQAQFARELWMKQTQRDMGQLVGHNRYVHLYLNGLYWGLYDLTERHNAAFTAAYLGGNKDSDWDVIHDNTVRDGDRVAWDALMSMVNTRNLALPENYDAVARLVDLENLIDYMILHLYAGAEDWDTKNWTVARRRDPVGRFIFFTHDQEVILDGLNQDFTERNSNFTPHRIWHALQNNAEFRLLVADRLHKHLFNDGGLTIETNIARYTSLTDQIDAAVVAESARWGDNKPNTYYAADPSPRSELDDPYTRNVEWLAELNDLVNSYFPGRHSIAFAQFRADGLYPDLEAAEFNQHGGDVPVGFEVAMSAPEGQIYYTLDGSDPRLPGGGLAPAALLYESPVSLGATTIVKARVRSGDAWSALTEARFATPLSLRISELMYHPPAPPPGSGFSDEDFEFVELVNIGTSAIDLAGARLTDGVAFTFDAAVPFALAPGEFALLVKNESAFVSRYGADARIAGEYEGRQDNAGERIHVEDARGATILEFVYSDDWYPNTDGEGRSLVPLDLLAETARWSRRSNWRESIAVGGSPGGEDVSRLLGDTNWDRVVDLVDLNNVRNNFGSEWLVVTGDTNGDHRVDLADLNTVRNNFGASDAPLHPGQEFSVAFIDMSSQAKSLREVMRAADALRSGASRRPRVDANSLDLLFRLPGDALVSRFRDDRNPALCKDKVLNSASRRHPGCPPLWRTLSAVARG